MSIIEIHDEEFARWLQRTAEQEQRSVEDVLKTMAERYPSGQPAEKDARDPAEAVRRVRRKAYAKARRYWESVGDHAKAALTDDELDEQFGRFDVEGIPRLKSEMATMEPPVGSAAYAAKIAEQSRFHSGKPDLAQRAEALLEEHFAEDFAKRMRGEDDAE